MVDMMREGSGEGICAETKWLTKECRGVNSQIRTIEVKGRFPRVGGRTGLQCQGDSDRCKG